MRSTSAPRGRARAERSSGSRSRAARPASADEAADHDGERPEDVELTKRAARRATARATHGDRHYHREASANTASAPRPGGRRRGEAVHAASASASAADGHGRSAPQHGADDRAERDVEDGERHGDAGGT
jgi:hypothetical protein